MVETAKARPSESEKVYMRSDNINNSDPLMRPSYSRKYLGNFGRTLGRISIGAAAKVTGILGAGISAYKIHYDALMVYLECIAE